MLHYQLILAGIAVAAYLIYVVYLISLERRVGQKRLADTPEENLVTLEQRLADLEVRVHRLEVNREEISKGIDRLEQGFASMSNQLVGASRDQVRRASVAAPKKITI